MQDDYNKDKDLYDDIKNTQGELARDAAQIESIASQGIDYAKRLHDAQRSATAAPKAASQVGAEAAKAGAAGNAAAAAGRTATNAAGGTSSAAGGAAAGTAGSAGTTAAGTAAGEAVGGAAGAAGGSAGGAAGGPIAFIVVSILQILGSADAREKIAGAFIIGFMALSAAITFIVQTRDNVSLDPIERSVYSAYENDFLDYPDEETAFMQAITAINAGIAASYNRTKLEIDEALQAQILDVEESKAATDYSDIHIVQYNPYKILAAYQVVHGARDYSPEKLQAMLAKANLFRYAFTSRVPKTKQHLYKTNNTPIASINGIAWDEPIDVPRYTGYIDPLTGIPQEIDWVAISAGQDWFVISVNADTVTIGSPEEVEYTSIQITRFDEKAALRAVGYDEEIMGDKYIEPDYEYIEDKRLRAAGATYFDNYRELWLRAESFRSDESSRVSNELLDGGYTVEVNITEQEKQELLKHCETIMAQYQDAESLDGQGMSFFESLVMSIENIIRPYVKNIKRVEPKAERMREMSTMAEDLKGRIEDWETSDDPNEETVTREELEDAIETMFELRDVAFYTIITNQQRKAIFKATREAINILDGTHLMRMDSYIDPITGEMITAEYGDQNVDITVSGEMSEQERQIRQQIIDAAKTFIGTPYGTGAGQVDCSMLVRKVYAQVFGDKGRCMEAVAADQAKYCSNAGVTIDAGSLRPGDLVFWAFKNSMGVWKRPDRYMHISHVGIYAGDGKIIDASSKNGKTVYRDMISESSIVMYGAPIYAITDVLRSGGGGGAVPGTGEDKVSPSLRSMDTYGILSETDAVKDEVISQQQMHIRYYCSCEKCAYTLQNQYGVSHKPGEISMSRAAATAFMLKSETDEDDNDPLGSIVTINDVVYKCASYNQGKYEPEGSFILIYTEEHHDAVQKNYDKPVELVKLYRYGE